MKHLIIVLLITSCLFSQAEPDTTFDISLLATGEMWAVFNRTVTIVEDGEKRGVYLDEKPGQGVAWLPSFEIGNGVIEVDLKGRNEPGKSFVGIAFHGVNAENYEVVYLRPFNFRADSEASRSHSVQYVLVPSHEWRRLRNEHPGQYESALASPPAPDAWVHLRLELDGPSVRVFIDGASEPALIIDRIGAVGRGWIGIWVGYNSDGMFANLKVSPL
ncbi:MAG TPA: hypothetical protein EYM74_03425 [Candidatus Marinimicrobia bacterium]|nr:hypothetical protein [Candidatus Neomarinimicrobiota bacterium]